MPTDRSGLKGSLARAWSAGALSVLIVISAASRIGVVVATMPSIMACFVSAGMNVVVMYDVKRSMVIRIN